MTSPLHAEQGGMADYGSSALRPLSRPSSAKRTSPKRLAPASPETVRSEGAAASGVSVLGSRALDTDDAVQSEHAGTGDPGCDVAPSTAESSGHPPSAAGSARPSRNGSPPRSPPAAPGGEAPRLLDDIEQLDAPVWHGISTVAPNAEKSAKLIEEQHNVLRRNLRATRDAVLESRFGQIQLRGPSDHQRVQQRTAHATYSHMMRKNKARDEQFRRNLDFERRFSVR